MNESERPVRSSSDLAIELRRLLAAAESGEKEAVVRDWLRANTQPDVPEHLAHQAMTLAEIFLEGVSEMAVGPSKKLVLVIHGIRDQGEWMEMVKQRLQSPQVVVQPLDFEDFDGVRFMTGIGVAAVIARVLIKIRKAKADHKPDELLVIAHSFGTFVIAQILKTESDIRFDRAVFCGSVIPRDFRFDLVPHCPKIVNECGGRDIWPVLAQGFSLWYKYGAAGVWGLRTSGIEDRFHDSGHSDYLQPEFVDKFWKPYVDENKLIDSEFQGQRRSTPRGVTLLGYGWQILIWGAVLTAICVGASIWLQQRNWLWSAKSLQAIAVMGWAALIYVIVSGVKSFRTPPKR